ncbi:MAG: cation:dicarboxylate symporter family transporter [Thermoprotei archaeon]
MKTTFKLTYELTLPFAFLLGMVLAYIVPYKLNFLTTLAWLFTNFFFIIAPIIIFIILTSSLSTRKEQSKLTNYTIISFFISGLASSILATFVISLMNYKSYSEITLNINTVALLETIINGLLKPIPLSIIASIIATYTIMKIKTVNKIMTTLNNALLQIFKIFVKILPIIAIAFGTSLYYTLKNASITAYIETLTLSLTLMLSYILILFTIIHKNLNINLKKLTSYTFKIFTIGASLPSSYILLPIHLKIFTQHFQINKEIRDFVITLGAALNRSGSIIGVIASVYITSQYLNIQITLPQYIILAILTAIIGFASPGIPGGTILITMPIIIDILKISNIESFSLTSIALFNGITIITAATNTITTGYITLLIHKITNKPNKSL